MAEIDKFFKEVLILKECSYEEIKEFVPLLKEKKVKAGEILFRQQDPGSELYIVKEGTLACTARIADGRTRDLGRFSRGHSFGEMAVIDQEKERSTTCTALTDGICYLLQAEGFKAFNDAHPLTGIKILKGMLRNMVTGLSEASNFLTTMCIWGEKARLRAITDEMTGLYNRRFFEETLELSFVKGKNKKEPFCLLMCDIDNFHGLNNLLGLQAGDELIRDLGEIFARFFKSPAIAARIGGDEFSALLPGTTILEAEPLANKFKTSFSQKKRKLTHSRVPLDKPVTISVGIAQYPIHGNNIRTLKEAADKALYYAKEKGKDRVVCAR